MEEWKLVPRENQCAKLSTIKRFWLTIDMVSKLYMGMRVHIDVICTRLVL